MTRWSRTHFVGVLVTVVVGACRGAPAVPTSAPAAVAAPTGATNVASATRASSLASATAGPAVGARASVAATPSPPGPAQQPAANAARSVTKATFVLPSFDFASVPVLLAKAQGYFRDEGIDLEITAIGSGSKATAAIVGGSADFGTMEFGDLLAAVARKQPVKAFAAFVTEPNESIVMTKRVAQQQKLTDASPLQAKLRALKGLKIGITAPGSATDSALRWTLLSAGLSPDKDVELVPLGAATNELAAFAQGQVQAFAQTSPWVETAVAKHDGFLVVSLPRGDVPAQEGRLSFALAARQRVLDGNPALLTAATRAVWRALRLIHEQPDEAKRVAKDVLFRDVDPDVYDLAWKLNAPAYPKDPRITPHMVQLNVDFRSRVTGERLDVTFAQAATNRFVDDAATTQR